MGQSTISMAIFNSKLLVYQRVMLDIELLSSLKLLEVVGPRRPPYTNQYPTLHLFSIHNIPLVVYQHINGITYSMNGFVILIIGYY